MRSYVPDVLPPESALLELPASGVPLFVEESPADASPIAVLPESALLELPASGLPPPVGMPSFEELQWSAATARRSARAVCLAFTPP